MMETININIQDENNQVSRIQKILSCANAMKDSLGITIVGIPIRANEIVLSLITGFEAIKRPATKLTVKELMLVGLVLLNFIHTVCGGVINRSEIETSFLLKYCARNLLYIIILYLTARYKKTINPADIRLQCKSIVYINIAFWLLLYIAGYRLDMGKVINVRGVEYSTLTIFGITIPRFFGTASEPGYLCPFFMMPLYYFFSGFINEKKYKIEVLAIAVMLIMTFSSIVYILAILVCIYAMMKSKRRTRKVMITLIVVALLLLCILIYIMVPTVARFVDDTFLNKIKALLGVNGYWDFSGNDRSSHYENCLNIYSEQTLTKKLLGIGTGGYAERIKGNDDLILEAKEAYNLFLSTLLDRGIIGLVLFIGICITISRFHIKNDLISDSIYVGIVSQYIHWMITGNMWLCYFWIEIIYLIGYYRWKKGDIIGLLMNP